MNQARSPASLCLSPRSVTPAKEQILVDDRSDEIDRRTDVTTNLFREHKMLDQMIAAGRTLMEQASKANSLLDAGGNVTAVLMPTRIFDMIEGYYLSPILNGWRPHELRHVEAGCALDEARGKPTRSIEALFPNELTPRLMPRAWELRAALNQEMEPPVPVDICEKQQNPACGEAKQVGQGANPGRVEPSVMPQFAFEF